jgi:molecular chaperone GrpE
MSDIDDVIMEPEDGEGSEQNSAGKIKDLREELKKAKKERDEYLDSLQRMKADYINAKHRFDEEKRGLVQFAAEPIILELLPIVDSLEFALAHEVVEGKEKGIQGIYNQLIKALRTAGSAPFEPLHEAFNPSMHESVETLAVSDESMDNIVTKVHQKGYTLHDRVIRPARVAVGHYETKP